MISKDLRKTISLIAHSLDQRALTALSARLRTLNKEPGGMGLLETMALHYCLLHRCNPEPIERKALYVVCAAQLMAPRIPAASPSALDRLSSLLGGLSPAAQLARMTSTSAVVVNAALHGAPESGVVNLGLAAASGDPLLSPAMTVPLVNEAVEAGVILAEDASRRFDAVALACLDGATNAPASALAAALFGGPSTGWVYCEPSLDNLSAAARREAVGAALARHRDELGLPFDALRAVGSIDLAVMAGFILGAALHRLPVVLDGFAASTAAALARRLAPDSMDVCIFSHSNASPAHAALLRSLNVTPILAAPISEEGGYGAVMATHLLDVTLRILAGLSPAATLE